MSDDPLPPASLARSIPKRRHPEYERTRGSVAYSTTYELPVEVKPRNLREIESKLRDKEDSISAQLKVGTPLDEILAGSWFPQGKSYGGQKLSALAEDSDDEKEDDPEESTKPKEAVEGADEGAEPFIFEDFDEPNREEPTDMSTADNPSQQLQPGAAESAKRPSIASRHSSGSREQLSTSHQKPRPHVVGKRNKSSGHLVRLNRTQSGKNLAARGLKPSTAARLKRTGSHVKFKTSADEGHPDDDQPDHNAFDYEEDQIEPSAGKDGNVSSDGGDEASSGPATSRDTSRSRTAAEQADASQSQAAQKSPAIQPAQRSPYMQAQRSPYLQPALKSPLAQAMTQQGLDDEHDDVEKAIMPTVQLPPPAAEQQKPQPQPRVNRMVSFAAEPQISQISASVSNESTSTVAAENQAAADNGAPERPESPDTISHAPRTGDLPSNDDSRQQAETPQPQTHKNDSEDTVAHPQQTAQLPLRSALKQDKGKGRAMDYPSRQTTPAPSESEDPVGAGLMSSAETTEPGTPIDPAYAGDDITLITEGRAKQPLSRHQFRNMLEREHTLNYREPIQRPSNASVPYTEKGEPDSRIDPVTGKVIPSKACNEARKDLNGLMQITGRNPMLEAIQSLKANGKYPGGQEKEKVWSAPSDVAGAAVPASAGASASRKPSGFAGLGGKKPDQKGPTAPSPEVLERRKRLMKKLESDEMKNKLDNLWNAKIE